MEYVKCNLCGSDNNEPVATQTDCLHRATENIFTVVRCVECGLHFTNPRPTPLEIGSYYTSGYTFHANVPAWRRLLNKLLHTLANGQFARLSWVFPPLAKRLVARVRPFVEDPVLRFYRDGGQGTFLDIGCGAGIHAHFWGAESALQSCNRKVDVAGVEVSASAREVLVAAGIRCWPDLATVPSEERFGMIRMNWSLEHVHSPQEYLASSQNIFQLKGRPLLLCPITVG